MKKKIILIGGGGGGHWNPARGSEYCGRYFRFRYPMNVKIDPPEGGLERPSIVKTGQILTVSKERLEKKLGRISAKKMEEVNRAIKLSLDLL
ncbi:MAG: type II toxin-antitoxin system PemK/MazF family toxin [Deltaproteobacteria bacterium]|jgi:mRNA interferase MazF|nr:type II toxin-antitoxin system PemK/MazF family toxin [Deltaproteobacteria bacterium]